MYPSLWQEAHHPPCPGLIECLPQVLCAHGAHVNAPGYKGMRPLHEAVENGHGELARLLLAYGADPALTTYAGQTCLALCADTQTLELMEGYLADLKGRTGTMWHFPGPARLFGECLLCARRGW